MCLCKLLLLLILARISYLKKKKDNNGGCLQWLHTLAKLNHKKEQKHEDVCVQDQPLPETCIFSGRIPMHTNAGEGLATVPPVPSHA